LPLQQVAERGATLLPDLNPMNITSPVPEISSWLRVRPNPADEIADLDNQKSIS
jgi:hypothetical protein